MPQMTQIMDPRKLEIVLSLYETRHFGRTAEELYMSTAHVSRGLTDLEHRLGAKLFDRGPGRPVTPTPQGHHLHAGAQQAMQALQDLPNTDRGDEAGTHAVRMGVLGAGLGGGDTTEIIRRWRELWPAVELVYVPLDSHTHDTAVLSGRVDIAVVCITGTEEDELRSHTAYSTQRAIVVPPGDPLAEADVVHPEQVADREMLYSVIPGRLGQLWSDLPVDQGRKDVIITDPAYVALSVLTTGRIANHSMAAASLGAVEGTTFVPLSGPRVHMGVQIHAQEQRPAVLSLYDIVQACTITGPDPTPHTS
ncbi:LysR family transcriptional regulator [Nocardiopsis salina]|uniref:LysR family transcriptional regulator n=1 Tax=Nocardiopsis salina TaxID=245836 RepID=UPI00034998C5|nr:LysR family transcriptional regulator [Nocardiopsis salina]